MAAQVNPRPIRPLRSATAAWYRALSRVERRKHGDPRLLREAVLLANDLAPVPERSPMK